MLKEITLAIILGSLLGVGLTGGFITLKKQGKVPQLSAVIANISPAPTPTASPPNNLSPAPKVNTTLVPTYPPIDLTAVKTSPIEISNYKSGQIVPTSKITVKGTAPGGSQIIIITPQSSNFTQATPEGLFEMELQLETGYNPLEITAIDSSDIQHQISFNLTYSTAKI